MRQLLCPPPALLPVPQLQCQPAPDLPLSLDKAFISIKQRCTHQAPALAALRLHHPDFDVVPVGGQPCSGQIEGR